MKYLPLLLILPFLACAESQKCFPAYANGFKICRASPNYVAKFCTPEEAYEYKYDDGTHRRRWSDLAGCYDPETRTALVQDNCSGAKAIPHEMAHFYGVTDPDKAGFDW